MAFVGAIYLLVSIISAGGYIRTGNVTFLVLGTSLVVGGCSAVLTFSLSNAPDYSATMADLGFLFSAILNFVCALNIYFTKVTSDGKMEKPARKWIGIPIITYCVLGAFSVLVAILAFKGLTPAFFVQGVGGTPLRQDVVIACIILFGTPSLLFLKMSLESHSDIMFWYGGGLAMLALAFLTFFSLKVVGGELSWTGRIAQHLSGIYFLMVVHSSTQVRETEDRQVSLKKEPRELTPESQ